MPHSLRRLAKLPVSFNENKAIVTLLHGDNKPKKSRQRKGKSAPLAAYGMDQTRWRHFRHTNDRRNYGSRSNLCNTTYELTRHIAEPFSCSSRADLYQEDTNRAASNLEDVFTAEGAGRSSEVERSLIVRWVVGSILHGVDPLSYFSFQPVLHDWCNKGRGMCYPVCRMVHIKEPLLLIDKSSLCGGSGFPFSLPDAI